MKKIIVFNPKGGVAKTTVALHIAHALSQKGRTLLVDLDPQGSSLAWAALSDETPFTVGRSLSGGFDYVVFDMAPAMPDRLPDADLYVVPTLLDGVSFVVFMRAMRMLREHNKRVVVVATRVNKQRGEHKERLKDPLLANSVIIQERAAFGTCYAMGKTVFDMDTPHIEKARHDIRNVVDHVIGELE